MSKYVINIGTSANAGDGDPLRTAFSGINGNFTALYNATKRRPQRTGAGLWYAPIWAVATAAASVVADNVYWVPHMIGWDGTITDVAINVSTVQAASGAKVALYSDSGGQPLTRLVDCTATAALDSSVLGVRSCTAAGNTISQAVNAGDIIWVAVITSTTAVQMTGSSNTTFEPYLPWVDPGANGAIVRQSRMISSSGGIYASGPPATTAGLTFTYQASISPIAFLLFA